MTLVNVDAQGLDPHSEFTVQLEHFNSAFSFSLISWNMSIKRYFLLSIICLIRDKDQIGKAK